MNNDSSAWRRQDASASSSELSHRSRGSRRLSAKGTQLGADRILELMVHAKERIPWVQADLVEPREAGPELPADRRVAPDGPSVRGVWVSDPVHSLPLIQVVTFTKG